MTRNLRIAYQAAPLDSAVHFENLARLRFRVLRRACFSSQLACAEHFHVGVRSVAAWESGVHRIPGWLLIALEHRARECGVVVEYPRAA